MGKTGNGTVTQSEESMTLMTAYGFPHHGSRSFTFVQDDALSIFLTTVADPSHSFRMTFNVLYKDHGVGRQKELWRT